LEQNTQEKFKQYALEFGFIVLGYAGNDRSIMDTFNTLLRSENNFPHGVYWCVLKGSIISKKVEALTRYPKFNIIEINGFDEFFAELHDELGIKLQPEMSDPYGSLAKRLNNLINRIKVPSVNIHPIIQKDIANLGSHIESISKNNDKTLEQIPIPYSLLSDISNRENNYEQAIKFKFKELTESPSVEGFIKAVKIFEKFNDWSELNRLMSIIETSFDTISKELDELAWLVISLMNNEKLDEAQKILEIESSIGARDHQDYSPDINFINRMIIKVKKDVEFNEQENVKLDSLFNNNDISYKFAVSILRKNYLEAEKYFTQKILEDKNNSDIKDWTLTKMLIPHVTNQSILKFLEK